MQITTIIKQNGTATPSAIVTEAIGAGVVRTTTTKVKPKTSKLQRERETPVEAQIIRRTVLKAGRTENTEIGSRITVITPTDRKEGVTIIGEL